MATTKQNNSQDWNWAAYLNRKVEQRDRVRPATARGGVTIPEPAKKCVPLRYRVAGR